MSNIYVIISIAFSGVANFNGQHGCLKCTTVGEYSYVSYTNVFPRIDFPPKTDEGFRARRYGQHHKRDSPLLQLNIDMIKQFPIADSLHLLHLGVMKRLLTGWRDGYFRNSFTKWDDKTTNAVSQFLKKCKMPREIHRAVRSLDCLAHWKGTEFRTFLMYVGIVALNCIAYEVYQHFLLLFCAITICESSDFTHLYPLAKVMLEDYIEKFQEIYGTHYMTSNFHNLAHLVDDVMMFGNLQTISSYPFENLLGYIKRLMRNGTSPLAHIARRLSELTKINTNADIYSSIESPKLILTRPNIGSNVPTDFHLVGTTENEFYSRVNFGTFTLSTDKANKWFLTQKNEIVCLKNIVSLGVENTYLFGYILPILTDFFVEPIKSSELNIYAAEYFTNEKRQSHKLFSVPEIKCKLVRIEYNASIDVFIPLLHTNQ